MLRLRICRAVWTHFRDVLIAVPYTLLARLCLRDSLVSQCRPSPQLVALGFFKAGAPTSQPVRATMRERLRVNEPLDADVVSNATITRLRANVALEAVHRLCEIRKIAAHVLFA